MNILLTCVGRRNYLVQFFREALGSQGRILAVDACEHAPALREADAAFVLPRLNDPTYLGKLLALCRDEQVAVLVPLHDRELPLVAARRAEFEAVGTLPIVSSSAVVDICHDKWRTFTFLKAHNIPATRTYCTLDAARDALATGEIAFPLVVKPRWGSGSKGLEYARDTEELDLVYALATKRYGLLYPDAREESGASGILIQERLQGDEYGLDVINDLGGQYAGSFARRKLAMRAGETDQAVTVCHPGLERLSEQISDALGHVGNLDCDVFVSGERCTVLEMNPRFGGGYPFAHAAGANLPAALIAWARGEVPDPTWLIAAPCITAAKCLRIVVTSTNQPQAMDRFDAAAPCDSLRRQSALASGVVPASDCDPCATSLKAE